MPVAGRRQRRPPSGSGLRKLAVVAWHSSCSPDEDVDTRLARHLDACRRRGLTVDEDFEVGITPAARALRTIGLVLCVVAFGLVCAALLQPQRFARVVTLRPAPMRSASPTGAPRPSRARPEGSGHRRTIRGAV
jgi:hypothetical protein